MPTQLEKLLKHKVVSYKDVSRMNDAQKLSLNSLEDHRVNDLINLRNIPVGARNAANANGNTYLGAFSGRYSQGSGNVFLGYGAGHNVEGDNQLVIANSTEASSAIISGDFTSGAIQVKGSIASQSGGFVFPDGTIQTTAAKAAPVVKSQVVYVNLRNEQIAPSAAWKGAGNVSIDLPSSGKVIVTYTGFFEAKPSQTKNLLYAIGLSSMDSPFDQPDQSNIQFNTTSGTGGFFPFVSRFVYQADQAGEFPAPFRRGSTLFPMAKVGSILSRQKEKLIFCMKAISGT